LDFKRTRFHYWTIRAFVEGWMLLLIRRGPRAFWREATRGPFYRHANFGFSRIALGYPGGSDVLAALSPLVRREPDPSVISPSRVRDFLLEVFPGSPLDQYLRANVALEEKHGPLSAESFEYDPFKHDIWGDLAGVLFHVSATGHLSFQSRSICRPPVQAASPSEEARLFDVVDVIDVVLPLYMLTAALASGANDRLLGPLARSERRYRWEFDVGERITFPTPLAGSDPVGFPGRIPAKFPLSDPRPEPSEAAFSGLRFSRRNCRPERVVEAVLADLLPHWGYENDPVVVAEVITTLRLMRSGPPVR
jgi:hypothetical protein